MSLMKLKYPSNEEVLNILKAGVFISAAFIAPNAIRGFKDLARPWQEFQPKYLKRKLKVLKEQKLVGVSEEDGKEMVKISEEGKKYLKKIEIDNLKIKEPKKWDGKWRVVIFDIPEDIKKAREYFRIDLENLGLIAVQKSVYIYPYPCFTELNVLREIYGLKDFVRFLVVKEIEREEELIEQFEIKS